LSLLFLAGLFYFFNSKIKLGFYFGAVESLLFDSAREKEIKEKSDQENKAYISQRAVAMQKNLESCKLLREKDKDSCYLDIANSNNNKRICELIGKKAIQDSCFENFSFKEAIDGKDVKACYNLASSSKEDCLIDYFRNFTDAKECVAVEGVDRQECLDMVNNSQAHRLGDVELCGLVADNAIRENCKQAIVDKPLDSDKDGLSDNDEKSFGTNPLNTDTDGDNVSDYDEIFKLKTNPLKLEIEEKNIDGI